MFLLENGSNPQVMPNQMMLGILNSAFQMIAVHFPETGATEVQEAGTVTGLPQGNEIYPLSNRIFHIKPLFI